MHQEKKNHISEGSCGVRWQKRQPQGPVNISAPWFLAVAGFIDFRLNGWCRCRAQTTALLCRCNILLSNKHQPGCQHEQLLLFKAVSFKGDELEWLGWCNQVGGLNVVHVIYENWGVDKLNSFVLFTSCGSRLTRMQTTDIFWSNVTFHFYIYWSAQLHITLKLIKKHKDIQVLHYSISVSLRLSSLCLLIPVVVGSGTAASPLLTC